MNICYLRRNDRGITFVLEFHGLISIRNSNHDFFFTNDLKNESCTKIRQVTLTIHNVAENKRSSERRWPGTRDLQARRKRFPIRRPRPSAPQGENGRNFEIAAKLLGR